MVVDFIDQVRVLSSRIANTKNIIQTEEATKNAMVMPFIQILGYNPFDPLEVTPELVADVGTKKGEKVDYAIHKDGKPIIIFECKKAGADLNIGHTSQIFRYFHVTEARFGVLTNGLVYKFFTDLEQPNKMDEKPFFEFNILDFKDRDIEELKKFAKAAYDLNTILTTAVDLKYTRSIQQKLAEWISSPSEGLVRLLSSDLLGSKRFTPAVKDQFTEITKRAFEQLIGEKINERLKSKGAESIKPIAQQNKELKQVVDEIQVYTEDSHLGKSSEEVLELYAKFKQAILNLSDDIDLVPKKVYLAFKKNKINIACVHPQKKEMKLWVGVKAGTLNDPKKLAKDISNTGHNGTGDYEINIKDDSDLEYIMSLVKQAIK